MTSKRSSPAVFAAILAVLAAAVGAVVLWQARPPVAVPGMTVIRDADPLLSFSLRDQNDAAFDIARLRGQWTFLFFGYTHCPDVCPTALATLRQVSNRLGGRAQGIQYVFVSVDPERDTRDVRRRYVSHFHGEFLGVSGSFTDLARLTQPLGVYFAQAPAEEGGDYQVNHSAAIFLINPQARLNAVFSAPQDPQAMADGFRALVGR